MTDNSTITAYLALAYAIGFNTLPALVLIRLLLDRTGLLPSFHTKRCHYCQGIYLLPGHPIGQRGIGSWINTFVWRIHLTTHPLCAAEVNAYFKELGSEHRVYTIGWIKQRPLTRQKSLSLRDLSQTYSKESGGTNDRHL